jgi:hypothetical protein
VRVVPKQRGWPILAALTSIGLLVPVALPTGGWTAERDKPIIGAEEEVLILPWEIRLRARVDTGAATSSLDARNIRVQRRSGKRSVRFTLVSDDGSRVALDLPLSGYHRVVSADSGIERRPVVRIVICVAGLRAETEVSLNDRSSMQYRMLLGRNVLEGRFLVDVSRSFATRPVCPPDH